MLAALLVTALVGYLLGSLPFGYLVARSWGVNIFEVGSKNPGATNVRRVLGAGPGNLVFALDALKGAVATAAPLLGSRLGLGGVPAEPLPLLVAGLAAALLGHSFSCFTRFRGGKGVATGAGGFLVLFPLGVLAAAATWGLTVLLTRYVSLGSMLAAVALTVAAWALHRPALLVGLCAAVTVFVIIRHRSNLSRLLAGTENKVGQKPAQPPAA
ncbi:MAG TPA: glycerol-3-phosphate 1-O-acyltransferase PlsY [Opitutaceae bacterium]|nr:glycerol-3-phosphate 1-O-acyltransferase PlsY [Opitutaceae bacterium]HND60744.1 glycerol-3-phosphate 1-O-acyltransferase PlsY [Opitutaceae bacterium]